MSMRQMSEGVLPGFCKIQVSIAIKGDPRDRQFFRVGRQESKGVDCLFFRILMIIVLAIEIRRSLCSLQMPYLITPP